MNLPECRLPKTHKEIVRIMVFSIPCLKDGQATSNTKARAPLPGFSRVIWDEWGKKGVRMDTKALKKQMGAAIAMVLVAAVALGSATFAWFVTNNKVDATTSTISAQSNAAFMTITNGMTGASGVDTTTVTTNVEKKALFPATYGEETGATKGQWMTGFGKELDDGTLNSALELCKDPNNAETAGSTAAAVKGSYALQQDYNISSKGQNLTNLEVDKVEVAKNAASSSELMKALRVLVTNDSGNTWVVYGQKANSTEFEVKLTSADQNAAVTLGDITAGQDTAVHVYLYYEGKDGVIKTTNLENNLLTDTAKMTVFFKAKAANK